MCSAGGLDPCAVLSNCNSGTHMIDPVTETFIVFFGTMLLIAGVGTLIQRFKP
jgi:hypothetical protein